MSDKRKREEVGSLPPPFREEDSADKAPLRWHRRAATLPRDKGAYLLLIRLTAAVPAPQNVAPGRSLARGLYVYCGSARGPGGIAARVGRHMRPEKGLRWHVDHLTSRAASVRALVFPGGDECVLLERVLGMEGISVPLPGLGASDCVRCPAHLLRADGRAVDVADRLQNLFEAVSRGSEDG
ncbi:GIY-YIG nuclease family protein [Rhodospirillum sp. A1_3_36]|uniref:GIY-YIG nuclease family protein n=1 Tax=Rhodospirillum sp. A1_3_36 TaxID=3391666 RepID=UPI0039A6E893